MCFTLLIIIFQETQSEKTTTQNTKLLGLIREYDKLTEYRVNIFGRAVTCCKYNKKILFIQNYKACRNIFNKKKYSAFLKNSISTY